MKGWLVTAVHVVAAGLAVSLLDALPALVVITLLVASFMGICVVKGTSPGGPSAGRHFKELRDQQRS